MKSNLTNTGVTIHLFSDDLLEQLHDQCHV